MIIVLLGASGSGKSTLEHELATHHGFEKIISYTTRQKRDGEENGKDYYFTNNDTFNDMINQELFAEYDEYSQKRLYGTLKSDYLKDDSVVVLTPNGLRQLKKNCNIDDIFTVLVEASLGTRIKRYVDRCNVNKFNFDDANEISEYAISAMNWAVGTGLMKGKSATTINPKDNATRAEIAAILQRFIEKNKTA